MCPRSVSSHKRLSATGKKLEQPTRCANALACSTEVHAVDARKVHAIVLNAHKVTLRSRDARDGPLPRAR